MALTSGTVTASNSSVNVNLVGANGDFMMMVKHTATLGAALTTGATVVQQMTCLDIDTASTVKQYLCVLTNTSITDKTSAVLTNSIYSTELDPATANFADAKYFDEASNGFLKSEQKAVLVY